VSGRVLRAVVHYGLGSYLPQLVNFLLLPLYTRLLSTAEMGIVEVCVTTQTLLVILMRLGLPGSISRFYFDHKQDEAGLRDMVTTIAAAIMGFAAALSLLVLAVGPMLFGRFLPEVPFHPYMDLVLASAFLQAAPDIQRRLLQARERSAQSARLSVGFGVLSTGLNLALVVGLRLGAEGVLWATLASTAVYAVVAVVNHRADLRGRFRRELLGPAISYGLPLVPHHAAAWAHQFINRWLLSAVSISMAGQLSVAARLASPLMVATGAFATAYMPVYFSWRTDQPLAQVVQSARRLGGTVLVLCGVAAAGAATFGTLVIRWATPATYHDAAQVLPLVVTSIVGHATYNLVGIELFYAKRTGGISLIFLTSAGLNVLVTWLLLPSLGILAAGVGQAAGGIAGAFVAHLLARGLLAGLLDGRSTIAAAVACAASVPLPWLIDTGRFGADLGLAAGAFVVVSVLTLGLAGVSPVRRLREVRSLLRRKAGRAP
jgi:O-antigen/teichoic acid export membrane protein